MKRGARWIIAWLPWVGALALVVYGWATDASSDAGDFASAFYAVGDFVTGVFAVGQTVAGTQLG
ncbi:MAG TPA: hypothetical protein VFD47_07890 [Actinomycetota bacterium]|nr:hypothetical protein [Actinomycetota bacterium]